VGLGIPGRDAYGPTSLRPVRYTTSGHLLEMTSDCGDAGGASYVGYAASGHQLLLYWEFLYQGGIVYTYRRQ